MIILSLHPSPDKRQTALQESIAEKCGSSQSHFLTIPPLHQIVESCAFWDELAKCAKNPVLACWLNPRPAAWLLRRHDIEIAEARIVDLHRFSDAESAFATIAKLAGKDTKAPIDQSKKKLKTKIVAQTKERWYPVLDGSRCINCGHCLQFCLFGVYALNEGGKVEVRHPDACKTGCPACARICPQSAIMFPLFEKDEAIAGAPGRFVTIDAAARRMFYARTKQPCPVCDRKASRKTATSRGKKTCPECGGPAANEKSKKNEESPERPAFDDLDRLVDQLDRAMQRRPKQHE